MTRTDTLAAPVAGHKCAGARMSVHVNCECGWSSANWGGPGARKNAYAEFRMHAAEHARDRMPP